MTKVYIQKMNSGLLNENATKAWFGFSDKGYELESFRHIDLPELDLTPETIVHGNVNTVREALRRLGAPDPRPYSWVKELNYRRESFETTLGEIRKMKYCPVFIKPLNRHKAFTGHVIEGHKDLLITVDQGDDLEILAQGVVDFVSEWRCFILDKKVLGISHYAGDPFRYPERRFVLDTIDRFESAPCAYSLDVGVLYEGVIPKTAVVEVNDSFSLGAYGLRASDYTDMIEARWEEMVTHHE